MTATATATRSESTAKTPAGVRPDPYTDPSGYLLFRGWRPLGFADHPSTLWVDPSKPLQEQWTTEPIMIMVERDKPDGKPGEKVLVREQLNYHTGKGRNQDIKPRVRSVCTPAGEPMSMVEALKVALHLERIALKQQKRAV